MPKSIKEIVLENRLFHFCADHGSEIDYIVGTLLNNLEAAIFQNKPLFQFSKAANIGITVGWNYFDAVFDVFGAFKQLTDTRSYRRTQSKIQASLNIISAIQLFSLSYNPLLTTYVGLANETDLAASSFAFSALFDLFVAALEFYNTKKEMEFKGWLDEKIKQLIYTILHGHDNKELIKDIHSLTSTQINRNPHKHGSIKLFLEQKLPPNPITQQLVGSLEQHNEGHSERSRRLHAQLVQAHKDSRVNLNLKIASFLGMTFLAVSRFLDSSTDAANTTLVLGLGFSTYVASAYFAYNSERVIETVSYYSGKFFDYCKPQAEPRGLSLQNVV
ncbi:MAG: hypothetical protein EPN84_07960 [Legionella sp.]|nr:MAG: hypothetical protein EPN84_07960 [Legionella sp.]